VTCCSKAAAQGGWTHRDRNKRDRRVTGAHTNQRVPAPHKHAGTMQNATLVVASPPVALLQISPLRIQLPMQRLGSASVPVAQIGGGGALAPETCHVCAYVPTCQTIPNLSRINPESSVNKRVLREVPAVHMRCTTHTPTHQCGTHTTRCPTSKGAEMYASVKGAAKRCASHTPTILHDDTLDVACRSQGKHTHTATAAVLIPLCRAPFGHHVWRERERERETNKSRRTHHRHQTTPQQLRLTS
jgi:hypothetical protein